jgi:hypothetical protein
VRQPFDHPDFLCELKHDGFRASAYISDGHSNWFLDEEIPTKVLENCALISLG